VNRGRGYAPRSHYHQPAPIIPAPDNQYNKDFDFEASNSHLQRTRAAPEDQKVAPETYNKSLSFFDQITHGNTSIKEGNDDRRFQQRTDQETFGTEAV
jgi:hypothetical protein